jgi:hypothetical protein
MLKVVGTAAASLAFVAPREGRACIVELRRGQAMGGKHELDQEGIAPVGEMDGKSEGGGPGNGQNSWLDRARIVHGGVPFRASERRWTYAQASNNG